MKIEITKEWCENMAKREDSPIGAGSRGHPLRADPRLLDCSGGMQLELVWSKDESVTTLHIALRQPDGREKFHKINVTPLQLDELRAFIAANLV